MALQSEMAATLQHHHTNGVLVSSAASPTPSIDSLTGMVVASNGTNAGLNGGDSGHEHSESGLASAGSGGLNTGANTDRVSSSSASSSGLGSSPLGNGSLFSSNATKCAICSGTFQRPKVWMNLLKVILFEIDCAIFYTNLHELFCQFISWTNWVNSGKFMDNCWLSCQVMADMKMFMTISWWLTCKSCQITCFQNFQKCLHNW